MQQLQKKKEKKSIDRLVTCNDHAIKRRLLNDMHQSQKRKKEKDALILQRHATIMPSKYDFLATRSNRQTKQMH